MRSALFSALVLVAACAETATQMVPVEPTPADKAHVGKIQPSDVMVTKLEPPPGCVSRGPVSYKVDLEPQPNYEQSIATMQQRAAGAGANVLVLDGGAFGRAFFCPPPCKPTCSPGFTCQDSVCVSACNPACKSGEACGGDRLCHPIEPVGVRS